MDTTPRDCMLPRVMTPDKKHGDIPSSIHLPEPYPTSSNEASVPLAFEELAPHVLVVKPARPALTYERME